MCARLYNFGGKAVTPQDSTYAILYTEKVDEEGNPYKEINEAANEGLPFATYDDAIAFINDHPDYILVGGLPFESPVPLEKLERYVLVHQSSPPTEWFGSTISYVKIFEYIP